MSMVPQPHRAADLIMGGAQGLAGSLEKGMNFAHQEQVANAPIHPAMQAYIERLMRGEDPTQLGLEARNDPNMQQLIDSRRTPSPSAQAANSVPDVGMAAGQPSLGVPGQFSPAAGPGTQPNAAPRPAAGGPSLGGPPPPFNPVQIAQPIQAPRVNPQQAFDAAQPKPPARMPPSGMNSAPGPGRQPPSAPSAAPTQPAPAGSPPITNRQFAGMQQLLPSMIAAQGRQGAAAEANRTKMAVAQLQAEKGTLLAIMKENGLDARHFESTLRAIEGMDIAQQQAVLKAITALEVARTQAGATLGAARTRAEAPKGEDPDEKELRNLQKEIARLTGKTDWEKQPELRQQVEEYKSQAQSLSKKLGKPYAGGGAQPSQAPAAPKKASPAPKKADTGGMPKVRQDGKVLVRSKATGGVGYVSPGFDPTKYEKL